MDSLRRCFMWLTASWLMTTTASPKIAPFFVPPRERMSTPTALVNVRIGTFREAAALAIREPSRWTFMPCAWAWSQIARISSGVYRVPSSVLWVIETTCGIARCSSSQPKACRSIRSGVSLPSGVCTVRSFRPPMRSGAPPSSTLMCALSAQITAPQRSVTA